MRHALRRLGGPDDPRAARALAAAWAPWRSYASQHLWQAPAARRRSPRWHHPAVTGFGPEHLPYGVFRRAGEAPRVGARLGDGVLDLAALAADGPLDEDPALFAQPSLNAFMAAGAATWARVREALRALAAGPDAEPATVRRSTRSSRSCRSRSATTSTSTRRSSTPRTSGGIFRPDAEPLLPNWRHLPVGYHGRAGSVVVTGHADPPPARAAPGPGDARRASARPSSSTSSSSSASSSACRARSARRSPPSDARDHVFGFVLVNDWSARDIQRGSTGRSARSWASRSRPRSRAGSRRWPRSSPLVPAPAQDPEPLPYLREEPWALDIELEVELNGEVITRSNARGLYWTFPQQLAHATVNGATCAPATSSPRARSPGREPAARLLLELTWNGAEPLALPTADAHASWRTATRSSCAAPAARSPSARSAGGSSRRADGAAQGPPPPGARRVRDDVRLRSLFVGAGLIPPRTMHSEHDAASCAPPAAGRRRVVELGVYEGSSAVVLCEVLDPAPSCTSSTPSATTAGRCRRWGDRGREPRVVARAARRHAGPRVPGTSTTAPPSPTVEGDGRPRVHRRRPQRGGRPGRLGGLARVRGARRRRAVPRRAGAQEGGRGLPGPTAVVDSLFRGPRRWPDGGVARGRPDGRGRPRCVGGAARRTASSREGSVHGRDRSRSALARTLGDYFRLSGRNPVGSGTSDVAEPHAPRTPLLTFPSMRQLTPHRAAEATRTTTSHPVRLEQLQPDLAAARERTAPRATARRIVSSPMTAIVAACRTRRPRRRRTSRRETRRCRARRRAAWCPSRRGRRSCRRRCRRSPSTQKASSPASARWPACGRRRRPAAR